MFMVNPLLINSDYGIPVLTVSVVEKLTHILQAVRALCKDSLANCKELRIVGHLLTLAIFIADSDKELLQESFLTVCTVCTTDPSSKKLFATVGMTLTQIYFSVI